MQSYGFYQKIGSRRGYQKLELYPMSASASYGIHSCTISGKVKYIFSSSFPLGLSCLDCHL